MKWANQSQVHSMLIGMESALQANDLLSVQSTEYQVAFMALDTWYGESGNLFKRKIERVFEVVGQVTQTRATDYTNLNLIKD